MSDADFYILHGHETFVGPCVHGRDPWTRCDECGEGNAVEALMKRVSQSESRLAKTGATLSAKETAQRDVEDECAEMVARLAEITRAAQALISSKFCCTGAGDPMVGAAEFEALERSLLSSGAGEGR